MSIDDMVAVTISARKSVSLLGWWRQPILTLSWNDVKYHHFTWRQVRLVELGVDMLMKLQTDKHEWLQRGCIQVSDLLDMTVFPVNPLTDFGVDLAELWQLQCTPSKMASMGITMDHLLAKGMSLEIIAAFAFSLNWDSAKLTQANFHQRSVSKYFSLKRKNYYGFYQRFCRTMMSLPLNFVTL